MYSHLLFFWVKLKLQYIGTPPHTWSRLPARNVVNRIIQIIRFYLLRPLFCISHFRPILHDLYTYFLKKCHITVHCGWTSSAHGSPGPPHTLGILSGRLRCSRSPVSGHGHRRTLFVPFSPIFINLSWFMNGMPFKVLLGLSITAVDTYVVQYGV